jgi:hypothetical protein
MLLLLLSPIPQARHRTAVMALPVVSLEARRLILLRPPQPEAQAEASAAAAHVVLAHSDEIRYVMSSPTPSALKLAEEIAVGMRPLVVGGLAVETSRMLAADDDRDEGTALQNVLDVRDFVIRGTRPGQASVIISERAGLLLADALSSSDGAISVADGSVSVLDFGEGTWPAAVADERPEIQQVGFRPAPEEPFVQGSG